MKPGIYAKLLILGPVALAAGCAGNLGDVPHGAAAYRLIPPVDPQVVRPYKIGPQDVLAINVFHEPDLSSAQIQVDAGGNLIFPLLGKIKVAGLSPEELSKQLEAMLGANYLYDPHVSVSVVTAVSQTVAVEGNVIEPGVYDIGGSATLLKALARAKSPTRVARLDEIVILRTINGQQMAAKFDLREIRAGRAPDPELRGGDIVVVGFDALKGAFRDFLLTAPFFNIFSVLKL